MNNKHSYEDLAIYVRNCMEDKSETSEDISPRTGRWFRRMGSEIGVGGDKHSLLKVVRGSNGVLKVSRVIRVKYDGISE